MNLRNIKTLNQNSLAVITALFFSVFCNISFFKNVLSVYEIQSHIPHLISAFIALFSFISFLLILLSSKYTTKPLLIIFLLISSLTSYFMDSYNVVIDTDMIINAAETDLRESSDLFNFKMILYVSLLGIFPAIFIYKAKIKYRSFKQELFSKIKFLSAFLIILLLVLFTFSKFYTSFFREHKPLRFYTNPTYWIYSIGHMALKSNNNNSTTLKIIDPNPKVRASSTDAKKKLIIMVVGEATRSDRFSINGYERETNPELKKEKNIISFSNMYSCGTSTAISVPCMFSVFARDDYSRAESSSTQNVLDILHDTNEIDVLWRDNNSDSKGVALRVDFEDFRTSENNTICDVECRDEGMLIGLDEYIKNHREKDILIVLHQMGNHGPAYYKRYTKEFEKFTPTCQTSQLESCSSEEIGNAYDNAILHTDHFLSKTINFLKSYSNTNETAMFYISDHGESLGENGLYLHGLPYFMAPDNQKHVASIIWLGSIKKNIDYKKLKSYEKKEFSHDNIFSTLLGFFGVDSDVYIKEKDITNGARLNDNI